MLEKFISLKEIMPPLDSSKRRLLIDHREFFKTHSTTVEEEVNPAFSYPEQNNFYAYCKLMGYEDTQIYVIMLINDLSDSFSFSKDTKTLLIPSVATIQQVLSSDT